MYVKNWACTPELPAMIIVQHWSHSKYISSSRNICNIFLVYRFSDCISSLSNLCMPRRKSWFFDLKLCCYFKRMLIIKLTNEIASFVINYSNKHCPIRGLSTNLGTIHHPRSQGLSFYHVGEIMAAAGHVPTSFPGLFPFCHWEGGKRPWHRAVFYVFWLVNDKYIIMQIMQSWINLFKLWDKLIFLRKECLIITLSV
jgi:hypothetical protein